MELRFLNYCPYYREEGKDLSAELVPAESLAADSVELAGAEPVCPTMPISIPAQEEVLPPLLEIFTNYFVHEICVKTLQRDRIKKVFTWPFFSPSLPPASFPTVYIEVI